jgi:hypothetical protein
VIEVMLDCTLFLFSGVFAGRSGIVHQQFLIPLVLQISSFKRVLGVIPQLTQGGTKTPSELYVELDCTNALFV